MIRFTVTGVDRKDIEEKAHEIISEYVSAVDSVVWDNGSIAVWQENGYGITVPLQVDARPIMTAESERPIAWVATVEADV